MFKYILINIIGVPICCFGQIEIKGTIIDSLLRGIPYANIVLKNTAIGTVSDSTGYFHFIKNGNININDTLTVTRLGFMERNIPLINISNGLIYKDSVKLEKALNQLSQIIVVPRKLKETKISNGFPIPLPGIPAVWNMDYPNNMLGTELGFYFTPTAQFCLLEKISIKIKKNSFDSIKYRVNIYSLENGFPKTKIAEIMPPLITNKKTGWTDFTLSHSFDEDIIVGIELIELPIRADETILTYELCKTGKGMFTRDRKNRENWNKGKGIGVHYKAIILYNEK